MSPFDNWIAGPLSMRTTRPARLAVDRGRDRKRCCRMDARSGLNPVVRHAGRSFPCRSITPEQVHEAKARGFRRAKSSTGAGVSQASSCRPVRASRAGKGACDVQSLAKGCNAPRASTGGLQGSEPEGGSDCRGSHPPSPAVQCRSRTGPIHDTYVGGRSRSGRRTARSASSVLRRFRSHPSLARPLATSFQNAATRSNTQKLATPPIT
jgi:hypothetical protein